ncbi:family 2A encapsulin nanocompartment cargo protein cysteine desulfurase [Thauera butanivorans]|uniref:family 2A encapsulin nanocompartment cargo protein cysteine desulfurase n=1 Tax=Thauera butanivorans TaxID=86174 RepID=UPI0009FC1288|nr:family 2A encapsulin nanocompartment cargo protein cysteine desulfurase [Thauera butanivorans]
MTTPHSIPTSEGLAAVGGPHLSPPPSLPSGLPAGLGLPEEALLSRLAGEFFALLPTGAPDAQLPFGAPPQPPQTEIALGNRAPALAPLPGTPAAAPDEAVDAAPAFGRAANPVLGVPEAHAAALPPIAPPQASSVPGAPSSPYYFLGEASAWPSQAESAGLPREDRVTARSFGLPGEAELNHLLGGIEVGRHSPVPTSTLTPASGPAFYFLDPEAEQPAPAVAPSAHPPFDVNAVRRDFPILQERVNGRQLIWLDNAATTHKPRAVIDRLAYFYEHENSNIHRAAHELAARATDAYEGARSKVARFLGAASAEEIIFVRGATEGINLIAKTWGAQNVGEGDEIIVSHLEHHANIVPWQQLAAAKGAKLRVIPVDDSGQVLLDEYGKLLNARTRIVAVTQVSNALGTVVPVKEIVAMAHAAGAKALVDGAQSVSHMRVNVQDIDADFFVFSGHKVFAPTGIGAVYGKREVLEDMPPWQGGGNMIADVTFEKTIYHGPPTRFEAGTGNIADAVGLGAAIDYVERIGMENIARYEHDLLAYATHGLLTVPGIRLIGTARDKASVLSFVLNGYTTEEVGRALNEEGIAVRSGHHCAQPILRRFGVEATVRPSLAFYNTCGEVDTLVAVLQRLASGRTSAPR